MAKLLEEDAMKLEFALESLDCPDPFANTALVPDVVTEAIRCGLHGSSCAHQKGSLGCLVAGGAMIARMLQSSRNANQLFAKSSCWVQK